MQEYTNIYLLTWLDHAFISSYLVPWLLKGMETLG